MLLREITIPEDGQSSTIDFKYMSLHVIELTNSLPERHAEFFNVFQVAYKTTTVHYRGDYHQNTNRSAAQ
jgi:hypothetical protein